MASQRQGSFAGGELAPTLWGRTDLERRKAGLKRCRNFFISHHGAALSRPGTKFIGEVKDSTKRVRLVPFIYSDETSYVLEFGHLYIRFYFQGELVLAGASPFEVITPYTEEDLPRLKFVQSGDVLRITRTGYRPRELSRLAHDNWTLAILSFDRPGLAPSESAFYLTEPLPASDPSHPAREWTYRVSRITRDEFGSLRESIAYQVGYSVASGGALTLLDGRLVVYADRAVTVQVYPEGSPPSSPVKHRVYRGRGEAFGWIGDTDTWSFTDVGQEPDYARPPPDGRNPFVSFPTSEGAVYEDPAAIAFFEDRCVFGLESRLWLSATGDYTNFDTHGLIRADDQSAEYELAARRREEIRALIGMEKLLVFTNSSIWSFGGAGGEPLSPARLVDAKTQLDIGCSWVDPLVVGNTVLMIRAKGVGVRDVFYDLQQRSFTGGDLSVHASHLFQGHVIEEWAYAEDPWGVVWAVRDDGALLSFTYERELGVAAWARHDTEGVVESICAVPETDEDGVYMVVQRTVGGVPKRYIERMTTRLEGCVSLDCFVEITGTEFSTGPTTLSGLQHLEGLAVKALLGDAEFGPFVVTDGAIQLPSIADIAPPPPPGAELSVYRFQVGLPFIADFEPLDFGSTDEKLVTAVAVEVEGAKGLHVGESYGRLTEWRQRKVSDGYGAISAATDVVKVNIAGTWNTRGQVVLRQSASFPITILGLTREVERGG